MSMSFFAGSVRTALIALMLLAVAPAPEGFAQSSPSPVALALAKEIIIAKGTSAGFDSIGPAIIERAKSTYLQLNPSLARDLNEVAAKLKLEYAPRFVEPLNEAAKAYAAKFTEQELKDILAFYKSPVGKKVVLQEPVIIEESLSGADRWAQGMLDEIGGKFRVEMKKKGHDL
jgi:hypothetical protein